MGFKNIIIFAILLPFIFSIYGCQKEGGYKIEEGADLARGDEPLYTINFTVLDTDKNPVAGAKIEIYAYFPCKCPPGVLCTCEDKFLAKGLTNKLGNLKAELNEGPSYLLVDHEKYSPDVFYFSLSPVESQDYIYLDLKKEVMPATIVLERR